MGMKLTDPSIEELTSLNDTDLVHVVDVSDTTDNPSGSSKKFTFATLKDFIVSTLDFLTGSAGGKNLTGGTGSSDKLQLQGTTANVTVGNTASIEFLTGNNGDISAAYFSGDGTLTLNKELGITGAAGTLRRHSFRTGALYRWAMYASTATESGANQGSDFLLTRYSDAGGFLNNPITIKRNSGNIYLTEGAGNIGVGGITNPLAKLHLPAGTVAANTAPLKIDAGVLLATPVTGCIESDGTHLYWTNSSGTRIQLDN